MKKCKKFLIIANETKDTELKYSRYAEGLIKEKGLSAVLVVGSESSELEETIADSDIIIVMGGDGTMLRVSHAIKGSSIPVIGVNLGTVGFLTDVVVTKIEEMIDRLILGDYEIEERMMLRGRKITENEETVAYALNEVVFARENALRLITVRLHVNDKYFDTFEADGLMIATPTGSTGYNLSAGGPIVKGDARLMVMTPISPYSLTKRSVIFGADDRITIELIRKRMDSPDNALCSFDGATTQRVEIGDKVEVDVSPYTFSLVKLDDSSLYERLSKKLGG